jgi:hypothetical protein
MDAYTQFADDLERALDRAGCSDADLVAAVKAAMASRPMPADLATELADIARRLAWMILVRGTSLDRTTVAFADLYVSAVERFDERWRDTINTARLLEAAAGSSRLTPFPPLQSFDTRFERALTLTGPELARELDAALAILRADVALFESIAVEAAERIRMLDLPLLVDIGAKVYALFEKGHATKLWDNVANADEALANAREHTNDVVCEAGLAELAQRRGGQSRALSGAETRVRLHLAAPVLLPTTYGRALDAGAIMDFFECARSYRATLPTRTSFTARVRGTIGETAVERELAIQVMPHGLSAGDMLIEWHDEPRALAELLEAVYGLRKVPHVEPTPENLDLEILAGCMGALQRKWAANADGLAFSPGMGGELEVWLS